MSAISRAKSKTANNDKLCQYLITAKQEASLLQLSDSQIIKNLGEAIISKLSKIEGTDRVFSGERQSPKTDSSKITNESLFATLQALKSAKKEAKNSNANSVTKAYKEIIQNHEVLFLLSQINEEIKTNSISVLTTRRFSGFFSFSHIGLCEVLHLRKEWVQTKKRIWEAALEAEPFCMTDKKITFIQRSQSSTLISILKGAPSKSPQLLNLNKQIEADTCTFDEWNLISSKIERYVIGTTFSALEDCINASFSNKKFDENQTYNEIKQIDEIKTIDNLLTLHVSVLRLLRMGVLKNKYKKMKEKIQKLRDKQSHLKLDPNWKKYISLIGSLTENCIWKNHKCKKLQRGQIVASFKTGNDGPVFYGAIVSEQKNDYELLVEYDNSLDKGVYKEIKKKKIIPISYNQLDDLIKNTFPLQLSPKFLDDNYERLNKILELFQRVMPFDLTDKESNLIKNPFPIIWASYTLKPENISGGLPEKLTVNSAVLGDDIQLAFTPKENVDQLKTFLEEKAIKNVQVFSFDAARYILGRDMNYFL